MFFYNNKDKLGYCNNYSNHKINRCSLLTSLECTCTGQDVIKSKKTKELFSSSSESENDSNDDTDDRFTLVDLLKGVQLFEKRNCKNVNAMKKLIMNFDGIDDISEKDSIKIFNYLDDNRKEMKKIGCLIIGQLCKNEDNAFKFLYHRLAERMIEFLNIEYVRESAFFTLEMIAKHKSLAEMWLTVENIDKIFIVIRMILQNPCGKDIKLSILNCLKAFSFHQKLANIIMDDTSFYLHNHSSASSNFREIFADLMGNLLLSCDSSKMSILKSSALPHCISMLKTGNCKVEETSLLIISRLISTKDKDLRDKILTEINHQLHSNNENDSLFDLLYNLMFNRFKKLARIEREETSKEIFVRLIPSIDTESVTLNRLSYLLRIIFELISNSNGLIEDRSDISRIDDLTGNGLLHIIDLLRVYSLQPKLTVKSINNGVSVRPNSGRRPVPQSALNIHNMLQISEIQLVIDLLKLIYLISIFGCGKVEKLEDSINSINFDKKFQEDKDGCNLLKRSIRLRLLQAGTFQAVGPWLSCRHSVIKKYAIEILENLLSPVKEISRPIPPPKQEKDRIELLRDALNSMSEESANIIEEALGDNVRIRSACVNSIRKKIISFRPMSAVVKGKNELVNEVYNSNWKPKIDYNKTILSQCYEQMKDHLLPLLYSLITGDEDIKLSILQFLYTFINNQTINNFSITDYGGIKVLLDCIRIWDKTSNINLLKMYVKILHEIIIKEKYAKVSFLKFDGTKVLYMKQRVIEVKPFISRLLKETQSTSTINYSSDLNQIQETTQSDDVWATITRRWVNEDRLMHMFRRPSIT